MYVAYGWPRVLSVKADSVQEDVIHLSLNDDYLVVISTVSIQIWSGDQHRVMLGQLRRDAESITSDGLNRRAVWCGSRRLLAVLVSNSQVLGERILLILATKFLWIQVVSNLSACNDHQCATCRRTTMCFMSMGCTHPRSSFSHPWAAPCKVCGVLMCTFSTALCWSSMEHTQWMLSVTPAACLWAFQMPPSSCFHGRAR